jgi:hypothetical protein
VDFVEGKFPPIPNLRGTLSEIQEDHSASRVATNFVFIFLVAAIIELRLPAS